MTFGKKFGSLKQRRALALTGMIGLFSTAALGCDTVALISFQAREFNTIEALGVTPLAGSCDGSDGAAMLRFVMIADDNSPIRPNEVLAGENIDVTRDDLTLTNGKLFELPDIQCSAESCVFEEFTCKPADESYPASRNRCLREASVDIDGAVQFESDVTSTQTFAVLIENSGSLDGWLPSDIGGKYPDLDADGFADPTATTDVNLKTSRATDRTGNRKVAVGAAAQKWSTIAKLAAGEDRKTTFGAWQFSGTSTAGVQSLVARVTPNQQVWTEQALAAENSIAELTDPVQDRANVYQAMAEVLENDLAAAEIAANDKTLVVFVDGPDDLRLNAYDLERVITAAKAAGVRIFIVQLDQAVATTDISGVPLFRDDPRYIEDQDNCASDADCRNYEECRQPINYSSTPGGAVESPAVGTYCLPARDDNGRIGPIQDYQRLACETEGAYIYVPSSNGLRNRMQWLPFTMDGLWKVETVIDALENGQVAGKEPYKVQSDFSVTLGGRSKTFSFSQSGDPLAGPQDEDQDTRTVIFSK